MEINLNPFLTRKRLKDQEDKDVRDGRSLGGYLLDQYFRIKGKN